MLALRRKSSLALIIGIIIMLFLIPIWYTTVVPSVIVSALEKMDITTSYEGTIGSLAPLPVSIEAHVYAEEVKGENVILKFDVNACMHGPYMNVTVPQVSGNSTYVLNKYTRENVVDAPEADKPREGYDYFYPLHLKAGEDVPNAWLDNLNTTATLEFKESIEEEGVTLFKYFAEKTMVEEVYVEGFGMQNVTLTATKTILVEPLSGLWVYTEKETVDSLMPAAGNFPLFCIEYNSTAEAKAQGLSNVKAAHDGMQLLELYVPTVFGVITVVLTIALAYNIWRLKRKKLHEPKTQFPAST